MTYAMRVTICAAVILYVDFIKLDCLIFEKGYFAVIRRFSYALLLTCLLSVSLLTACERPGEKLPPISEDQHPKPAPVVVPAEDLAQTEELARHSSGLGLTRAAFEIHHGKIVPCGGGSPYLCVQGRTDIAITNFNKEGRITGIILETKHASSMDDARFQAGDFLPKDRQLIKTYALGLPEGEVPTILLSNPIDLYHSDWLAQQFSEQEWNQVSKSGVFNVMSTPLTIDIRLGEYK